MVLGESGTRVRRNRFGQNVTIIFSLTVLGETRKGKNRTKVQAKQKKIATVFYLEVHSAKEKKKKLVGG